MNPEPLIRQLARSPYYLRLYNTSKEIGNINMFENNTNFSGLQTLFLYWLQIYSMLYKELGEKDWLNLDLEIIKDDIRCDAFLYWRSRNIEKDLTKYKEEMRSSNRKNSKNKGKGQTMPIYAGPKK